MPTTMTAPSAHESLRATPVRDDENERNLTIDISFKDCQISLPRYGHVHYADYGEVPDDLCGMPGKERCVPEAVEIHPAFIATEKPSFDVELNLVEGCEGESPPDAASYFFQRAATGLALIDSIHHTNPLAPPLIGSLLREDGKKLTLTWRADTRIDRSASYALYVTDPSALDIRTIPLAIGNLEERGQRQEYAEKLTERRSAGVFAEDAECPDENDLDLTLGIYEVAGQARFSIFNYENFEPEVSGKLPILPEPLFRFDPSRPYTVCLKAIEGFRFELDCKDRPKVVWFNSVTGDRVRQPQKAVIIAESETKFFIQFGGPEITKRRRDLRREKDLPAPGWLTSFFVAGSSQESRNRSEKSIWADPTLVEPDAEDPGPGSVPR